ncbi:MAG TPA: hypothetical protein VKZ63_07165 [Kofleriaceae bacterium]|nr:hypothetical protein [Kofleriaceae bacterium]
MRAPACLAVLALGAAACGDDDTSGSDWHVVQEELPGALLSVWGGAPDDVWAVGGDPDQTLADNGPAPPQVLHWDGAAWETLDPGTQGSLWWVFGRPGGAIYMGGENATIVKYEGGAFSVMDTPGTTETVFGIWGCSEDPSQVWAVGGNYGGSDGAFAWRLDGDAWVAADGFPSDELAGSALWKVHGRACDDAYMVGTNGIAVRWDGQSLTTENTGVGESLFTVHASADRYVAVGGFGGGIILENDGAGWQDATPDQASAVVGVCTSGGGGVAVGWYGEVHEREDGTWRRDDSAIPLEETLHATWIDPDGGVWAVGGQVQQYPLERGVMVYRGESAPVGE